MDNLNVLPVEAMQALNGVGASFGLASDIQFEPSGREGVLQMTNTGSQHVEFKWEPFRNQFKTDQLIKEKKEKGDHTGTYPIYDQVLIVSIHTAGHKEPWIGRAEDYHKRTYFPQYKRFLDGKDQVVGTPIEKAEFLQGIEAMELRARGVQTIEQLAASGDVLCEVIPRGYEIRDLAKMEIEVMKETSVNQAAKKLSAELNQANDKISALHAENLRRDKEMKEMQAMFKAMVNAPKQDAEVSPSEDIFENVSSDQVQVVLKPRGRPKKNV